MRSCASRIRFPHCCPARSDRERNRARPPETILGWVKTVPDPVLPKRLKTSPADRIAGKLPESAKASGPGMPIVTSGERVRAPVTGECHAVCLFQNHTRTFIIYMNVRFLSVHHVIY